MRRLMYAAAMPAVKAANPRNVFAPEDWAAITAVSNWRGIWLIVHAWLVVAIAAFGAAWAWGSPAGWNVCHSDCNGDHRRAAIGVVDHHARWRAWIAAYQSQMEQLAGPMAIRCRDGQRSACVSRLSFDPSQIHAARRRPRIFRYRSRSQPAPEACNAKVMRILTGQTFSNNVRWRLRSFMARCSGDAGRDRRRSP